MVGIVARSESTSVLRIVADRNSKFQALVHVIPDLDPRSGGTVAALVGLAIAQRERGMSVCVVTTIRPDSDNREIDRLRAHGVEVIVVAVGGRLRAMRPLANALSVAISQGDCVHVHAIWEEIQHQACRIARKLGKPYIISPHGMLDPWSLSQGRLKKLTYLTLRMRRNLNCASAIHCTTATESRLLEPLSLRPQRIVLPNGIDLSEFSDGEHRSAAERFIHEFPAVAGKKVVLFLSRLHPKKGLDILLPAAGRALDSKTMLVIAGPGDAAYVKELRREVARLNLQQKVIFTGMLHGSNRIAAFRAADLYVLPSYQENFGISVIEALAAGTPVVISDQVNLAEVIQGAGVGEVIPPEVDSLATALQSWTADPYRCKIAGQRGIAFVRQYAFEEVAERWAEYFVSLQPTAPRDRD